MQPRPSRFDLLIIRSDALLFYNASAFGGLAPPSPAAEYDVCAYTYPRVPRLWIRGVRSQQKRVARRPADYSSAAVARRAPTSAAAPASNSRSLKYTRVRYTARTYTVYTAASDLDTGKRPHAKHVSGMHEGIKERCIAESRTTLIEVRSAKLLSAS